MENKWFYCINNSGYDRYSELEYEISDDPTDKELNAIAQKILRDNGYTSKDDFVSIGIGELISIEDLGNYLGDEIVERLNEIACDRYDCEDNLIEASKDEIADLDRRIAQILKEWGAEHSVMCEYYTIPNTKEFSYKGDGDE